MRRTTETIGIRRHVYDLDEADLCKAAEDWLRKQVGISAPSLGNPYKLSFDFRETDEGKTTLSITQDFTESRVDDVMEASGD